MVDVGQLLDPSQADDDLPLAAPFLHRGTQYLPINGFSISIRRLIVRISTTGTSPAVPFHRHARTAK